MIKASLPIFLASKSPRRRKLLKQLGLNFKSFSIELEEKIHRGEKPSVSVKRLSLEKLTKAKSLIKQGIIITADTIVVLDGKVIGKPESKKKAEAYLKKLSGRVHTVYTGFSVYNSVSQKVITGYEKTKVKFRRLNKNEIKDYVKSGSPMDKAGAYGIQDDFGAVFVERINGCYYNVVGLPLTKLYTALLSII